MAAYFKVDCTYELINTPNHLGLYFLFNSQTVPDPCSAGVPTQKGSGHMRLVVKYDIATVL